MFSRKSLLYVSNKKDLTLLKNLAEFFVGIKNPQGLLLHNIDYGKIFSYWIWISDAFNLKNSLIPRSYSMQKKNVYRFTVTNDL